MFQRGFKWPVVLWAAGSHFTMDIYMNLIPPLLPLLAKLQGFSLAQTGLVLSVHSITASFLQPFAGMVMDKWGRPWLLAASLAFSAITVGLIGLFPTYTMLLLLFGLAGLGSSLLHPLGSVTSVRAAGSQPGLAVSIFSTGGNLGFALGPALAVPLVSRWGLKVLFYLVPFGLMYAIALFAVRQSLVFSPVEQKAVVVEKPSPVSKLALGGLLLLNIVSWLRAWAQFVVTAYVPYHFINQGYDVTVTGPFMTLYLIAGTMGTFAAGFLSDRFGRRALICGSLAISLGSIWLTLNGAGSWAWVGVAFLGAAMHAMVPVAIVIAQELVPQHAGMAAGMMLGLAYGLGGLCTPLIGMVADNFGLTTALNTLYPIMSASFLLSLLLPFKALAQRQVATSQPEPQESH
ncbi:MAG: MFS transporter [Firmicutes bacterium]|nr:MFS transporter [Bacillota bacterium]